MKFPVTAIGRLGLVVAAMGLAIFLVSQIPGAPYFGRSVGGSLPVFPDTVHFTTPTVVTPNHVVEISVNASGDLKVYLLALNVSEIMQREGPLIESLPYSNTSEFLDYVERNPDVLIAEYVVKPDSPLSEKYSPTTVHVLTVAFANFGEEVVEFEYEIEEAMALAPPGRAYDAGLAMTLVGLALALPFIISEVISIRRFS